MKNKTYREIYRKEFGIRWDGGLYDIHHVNFNHDDNRIENLLLLPKKLHHRFHNILKSARFEWDETLQNYIVGAFMYGADGILLDNLEWFSKYAEIIKGISFWGYLKANKYQTLIEGKPIFDQVKGLWKE